LTYERPVSGEADKELMRLGDLLVLSGKITTQQAEEAARISGERKILFGQAAVILGFVSRKDLESELRLHGHRLHSAPSVPAHLSLSYESNIAGDRNIRRLARNLVLRWFRSPKGNKALAVISPDRGEGRTTMAVNLAVSLARDGARTFLVGADLHNPGLERIFHLSPKANPTPAPYKIEGFQSFSVMPASELLKVQHGNYSHYEFATMIDQYRRDCDVILIDTAAGSASLDYIVCGLAAGGAMMVAREGVSKGRHAAKMLNICEEEGITVVGGTLLQR
jgi:protein-tyrosine kinase